MLLISELRRAREGKGWTREALAREIGTDVHTVTRLESGSGSVTTLVAAMKAVDLHFSNVAKGATIVEQIVNARTRTGLTKEALAAKAGISPTTLRELEKGRGTVAPLLRVLSAVAPRARKAEPIRASWAFDRSGERDKRFTPAWFLDHVVGVFGDIDLDPCGHEMSSVVARRRIMLPACGIASGWGPAGLAFVNPPFSGLARWIDRASAAYEDGEVETVLMLCPVRTDTRAFVRCVPGRADVGLLKMRMKFDAPAGVVNYTAPFALMVIAWGASMEQITQFDELVPATWLYRDRTGFSNASVV